MRKILQNCSLTGQVLISCVSWFKRSVPFEANPASSAIAGLQLRTTRAGNEKGGDIIAAVIFKQFPRPSNRRAANTLLFYAVHGGFSGIFWNDAGLCETGVSDYVSLRP
jgi:hypothetical protein